MPVGVAGVFHSIVPYPLKHFAVKWEIYLPPPGLNPVDVECAVGL